MKNAISESLSHGETGRTKISKIGTSDSDVPSKTHSQKLKDPPSFHVEKIDRTVAPKQIDQ
jgi:hypothetical protein